MMFKKIRNKILMLNMTMLSIVVVVAMAAVFITVYMNVQNENKAKLGFYSISSIVSINGFTQEEGVNIHMEPAPSGPAAPSEQRTPQIITARRISPGAGLSFSLTTDSQGNIMEINSVVDLPENIYSQAAMDVVNKSGKDGMLVLDKRKWQYTVSPIIVELKESYDTSLFITKEFNNIRFLDVTDSQEMLTTLALTLLGLTVAILVIFFFISRLFANRAIRPMEEAWDKQGRFVADASHELKTPLSVINASCGVLYTNKEEIVGSQLKWVDSILSNTDRMTGLINGLLSLARMDDVQQNLQFCSFNLSDTVENAIVEIEPLARDKALEITQQIGEGIEIVSDQEHVRQILFILLDNAVKYTQDGGSVYISLKKTNRHVVCAIRNTGEGISEETLPHVFDRFYRGDPARCSKNGGYGLGLAIAKDITQSLGAKLTAKSKQGEYAEFTITFDKKAAT